MRQRCATSCDGTCLSSHSLTALTSKQSTFRAVRAVFLAPLALSALAVQGMGLRIGSTWVRLFDGTGNPTTDIVLAAALVFFIPAIVPVGMIMAGAVFAPKSGASWQGYVRSRTRSLERSAASFPCTHNLPRSSADGLVKLYLCYKSSVALWCRLQCRWATESWDTQ